MLTTLALSPASPDALDTVGVELEGGGDEERGPAIAEDDGKTSQEGRVGESSDVGAINQGHGWNVLEHKNCRLHIVHNCTKD